MHRPASLLRIRGRFRFHHHQLVVFHVVLVDARARASTAAAAITTGAGVSWRCCLAAGAIKVGPSQGVLQAVGVLVGIAVSLVVSYFALKLLWKALAGKKFYLFAFYCWLLGAVLLALSLSGV